MDCDAAEAFRHRTALALGDLSCAVRIEVLENRQVGVRDRSLGLSVFPFAL